MPEPMLPTATTPPLIGMMIRMTTNTATTTTTDPSPLPMRERAYRPSTGISRSSSLESSIWSHTNNENEDSSLFLCDHHLPDRIAPDCDDDHHHQYPAQLQCVMNDTFASRLDYSQDDDDDDYDDNNTNYMTSSSDSNDECYEGEPPPPPPPIHNASSNITNVQPPPTEFVHLHPPHQHHNRRHRSRRHCRRYNATYNHCRQDRGSTETAARVNSCMARILASSSPEITALCKLSLRQPLQQQPSRRATTSPGLPLSPPPQSPRPPPPPLDVTDGNISMASSVSTMTLPPVVDTTTSTPWMLPPPSPPPPPPLQRRQIQDNDHNEKAFNSCPSWTDAWVLQPRLPPDATAPSTDATWRCALQRPDGLEGGYENNSPFVALASISPNTPPLQQRSTTDTAALQDQQPQPPLMKQSPPLPLRGHQRWESGTSSTSATTATTHAFVFYNTNNNNNTCIPPTTTTSMGRLSLHRRVSHDQLPAWHQIMDESSGCIDNEQGILDTSLSTMNNDSSHNSNTGLLHKIPLLKAVTESDVGATCTTTRPSDLWYMGSSPAAPQFHRTHQPKQQQFSRHHRRNDTATTHMAF